MKELELEKLISLIEQGNNEEERLKALKELSSRKVFKQEQELFQLFENLLVSDENPNIQAEAARALFMVAQNKPEKLKVPFAYVLQNSQSIPVLKAVYKLLESNNSPQLKEKVEQFRKRLSTIFRVSPEEAMFYFDLKCEHFFREYDGKCDLNGHCEYEKATKCENESKCDLGPNAYFGDLSLNLDFLILFDKYENNTARWTTDKTGHTISLYVFGNIRDLPKSIFQLGQLRKLKLENVKNIPENWDGLKFLKEVKIIS